MAPPNLSVGGTLRRRNHKRPSRKPCLLQRIVLFREISRQESTADGRALKKEAHTTEDIPTEPQDPPQERHKDETIKRAGGGEKSRSASDTARDQNELPYIIKRTKPKESSNGVVEKSSQWEKTMPSSILEKGIIYFI